MGLTPQTHHIINNPEATFYKKKAYAGLLIKVVFASLPFEGDKSFYLLFNFSEI